MISITYDPVAKRFISLGEIKPFVFIGLRPVETQKRKGREIDGGFRARAAGRCAALRLRRGGGRSQMAPQGSAGVGRGRL